MPEWAVKIESRICRKIGRHAGASDAGRVEWNSNLDFFRFSR
jgi:hypothetical protein